MKTTLDNWFKLKRGYRHGDKTFYSDFHLGVDLIVPIGTPVYAPADGKITNSFKGSQGGNMLWYEFDKYIMRVMHLRDLALIGDYKQGSIIGYTGNTGLSTAPHAHIDISYKPFNLNNKLNFIDPELFFNNMKQRILVLKKSNHNNLLPAIELVKQRIKTQTNGELIVEIDFQETDMSFRSQNIDIGGGQIRKVVYAEDIDKEAKAGYDVVCFVFDSDKTFTPYHNRNYSSNKGHFITQLPLLPVNTADWICDYFVHELLHAWFTMIQRFVYVRDSVHDQLAFDKIIKDLQPYYKYLITNMSNTKKIKDENSSTVGFLLPALSEDAYKSLAKNFGLTVALKPDGSIDWANEKLDGIYKLN